MEEFSILQQSTIWLLMSASENSFFGQTASHKGTETVAFLHAANVIWTVCYGVKDVLLLRVLAVVAMLVILPHYYFGIEDIGAVYWTFAFMAINLGWIVCIVRERMPPNLTDEQKRLYALTFEMCSPREMLALLQLGTEMEASPDHVLISKGATDGDLVLIREGRVTVKDGDRSVARLSDGDFVGEMSFLGNIPATASVECRSSVKYIRWKKSELQAAFKNRLPLESALRSALGTNLVEKLSAATSRAPELTRSLLSGD